MKDHKRNMPPAHSTHARQNPFVSIYKHHTHKRTHARTSARTHTHANEASTAYAHTAAFACCFCFTTSIGFHTSAPTVFAKNLCVCVRISVSGIHIHIQTHVHMYKHTRIFP